MPNTYTRLNLASAIFPFYTEAAGRSVMVPGNDENFDRYNAANTTPDKGVPQVFYMHNVLPIAGGFQSIGYKQQLTGLAGATDFDQVLTLRDPSLNSFLFVPAGGKNYIYDADVGIWVSKAFTSGVVPQNVQVTTATIQSQTYICFAGYGTFKYNVTTKNLDRVVLTSLDDTQVIGICAANGYMIACSATAVSWSSLTQPTNFAPNIQTGAGGGNISDAKGRINFVLAIAGGFLIYCEKNIVGAVYTANTSYPYIFTEVPNSGGCPSPNQVSWQGNMDTHTALTSTGVQQFNKSSAASVVPELTDFLASQVYEDFDEGSNTFSSQHLGVQVSVKISTIANRFIVFSYGPSGQDFTHAIVMDTVLNRYGKLKINHRCCFEFNNPAPYGTITYAQLMTTTIASLGINIPYSNFYTTLQIQSLPKKTFAFLQKDGTVQTVEFELGESVADGVFIIGKFQLTRDKVIVHQFTELESVEQSNAFSFYLLPTFDGKTFGPAVPILPTASSGLTRKFALRYTASNLSLLCKGAFNLTSMVLNNTQGGSR